MAEGGEDVEGIAAYNWTFNFLIRGDGSQSMQGMLVSKDYMPVMGLKPMLGRGFEERGFSLGPTKAILLGYEFWQRAFTGDPQIIGKTVRISRWRRAAYGDRRDAAGGTVSSVAGGLERAELQRERD